MSITKPSRSMLSTGISDSSDATFLTADSSENATFAGNLTVSGNLTVTGTTTQVDTVTMNAQNAVLFEGATADSHETTLTTVDPTGDRTISLPNVSGTLPVLAAASATAITATPAEINLIDGGTARGTTALASGDGILINDNGTMRMTDVDTVKTFMTAGVGFDTDAAQVFNESGAAVDFRIESDDNANMLFVDGSEDSIGIGTATPNRTLSVSTGLAKTSTTTAYPFAIQSNESSGNAQLSFHAIGGASAAVRRWLIQCEEAGVANAGNIQFNPYGGGVSIGSGIPNSHHSKANRFMVGSGGATGMSVYNGTGEGWYAFSRDNANNTDAYDGGISYDGDRDLRFHTNAGATRMTIAGDGAIGINNDAPVAKLDIIGSGYEDIRLGSNRTDNTNKTAGITSYMYTNNTVSLFQIFNQNGNNAMYYGSADGAHRGLQNHYWYVNAGYNATTDHRLAMQINSSGGVVMKSSHQGDTVGNLHISSEFGSSPNTSENALIIVQNGGQKVQVMAWAGLGARVGTRTSGWNSNSGGNCYLTGQDATNIILTSGGSPTLANGTAISSDRRLKENIIDIGDNQLDKINLLRPRTFTWKDPRKSGHQEGFIAQEVEEVMPEAVEERASAPDPEDTSRDFEGDIKVLKHEVINARLVKAVQELSQKVADKDGIISALEQRIHTIEQRLI